MNRAKFVISFLLGAGVGGLVTWKLLASHYEGILQDELDSIEAELLKKRVNEKDRGELVTNEYENVKKRFNIEEQRAEDVDPDEEEEVDFPDDYETPPQFDVYPVPYPISEEEFSTECLEYDKLSLKYYTDDSTLCDDQEVPIDDPLQVVGEETADYLSAFLNHPQHEDLDYTIYVRNEGTTADYEITIVENSYAAEVLGYDTGKKNGPPPRKIPPKEKKGGKMLDINDPEIGKFTTIPKKKGKKVEDGDDE